MSSIREEGAAADTSRFELLVRAALDLTAEHDLDTILERMVARAAEVADARYAALGVYQSGRIERFVHHGIDAATVAHIGHLPHGKGLLGEVIVADRPIRLADIASDPRSVGFPSGHPPMRSFLGVPVRIGTRRFGNLYLTEKAGGGEFTDQDEKLVATLATFAAAAIEGALLLAAERDRASSQERATAQQEVLGQIIAAQEAERARVARDLHDQIGQALTSVLLSLKLVTDALGRDPADTPQAVARADDVRTLVADALQDVRQLAFDLRPTVLDDVGLVPALRRLVGDHTSRNGVPVEIHVAGVDEDTRFAPEIETVVYRVVQEALTNVARHARARRAVVSLARRGGLLCADIEDDGAGFDPPVGSPRSLGLAGMTERASLVGGHIRVASAPGSGTTVVLEVPLD